MEIIKHYINYIYFFRDIIAATSGEVSLTIWSCYANISMFIDCKNNQSLNK